MVVIAVIHSQDNQLSVLEGTTSTSGYYWPESIADEDNHALVKRTEYEDAEDPRDMPLAESKADITAVHDNRKVAETVAAKYKWIKRKQETKEHHAKQLKKEMADVFRTAHEEVKQDQRKAYIKAHPHSKQAKAARKKHVDAENAAKKAIKLKKMVKENNKKAYKKSLELDNKMIKGVLPSPPPLHQTASLKKSMHEVDAAMNKADKIARHAKLSASEHKLTSATDKVYATIGAGVKHAQEAASANLKGAIKKLDAVSGDTEAAVGKEAAKGLSDAIARVQSASNGVFKGTAKKAASSFAKSISKLKADAKTGP